MLVVPSTQVTKKLSSNTNPHPHSNMTHAQAKFIRRQLNAKGRHPAFGTPIPGKLSEIEVAHKNRRAARRHIIVEGRIKQAEFDIMQLKQQGDLLAKNDQTPKNILDAINVKINKRKTFIADEKQRLARLKPL